MQTNQLHYPSSDLIAIISSRRRLIVIKSVQQILALCHAVILQGLLYNLLLLIRQTPNAFRLYTSLRIGTILGDNCVDLGNIATKCGFNDGCHSTLLLQSRASRHVTLIETALIVTLIHQISLLMVL